MSGVQGSLYMSQTCECIHHLAMLVFSRLHAW